MGDTAVAPTDEQFKDFATQVNGGNDMSFEMQAHPRRLHFEASATVMAELSHVPLAEKAARLKEQEARLPGLRLKGELQPSCALIDLVVQVKETNCTSWIPLSKCSKRDSKVQNSPQGETHDAVTGATDGQTGFTI